MEHVLVCFFSVSYICLPDIGILYRYNSGNNSLHFNHPQNPTKQHSGTVSATNRAEVKHDMNNDNQYVNGLALCALGVGAFFLSCAPVLVWCIMFSWGG